MRPNPPDPEEPDDLCRARLSQQLDQRHPLVRLAGLIDWQVFETRFGELYHPHVGRPGALGQERGWGPAPQPWPARRSG